MVKEKKELLFGGSLKDYTNADMALLKFSLIVFPLFLVSVWPGFANWVTSTHWGWFLGAWIISSILPVMKYWKK